MVLAFVIGGAVTLWNVLFVTEPKLVAMMELNISDVGDKHILDLHITSSIETNPRTAVEELVATATLLVTGLGKTVRMQQPSIRYLGIAWKHVVFGGVVGILLAIGGSLSSSRFERR